MHSCVCRTTSFTSPTRRYRSVPPGRLGSGTGTQKLCFNGENIESWGSSSYSTVDILYLFLFMLVRGPGPRRQSPPSAWSYLIPWHSAINGNSHTKLEKMLFVRSYWSEYGQKKPGTEQKRVTLYEKIYKTGWGIYSLVAVRWRQKRIKILQKRMKHNSTGGSPSASQTN
jgi:hypothetical protein